MRKNEEELSKSFGKTFLRLALIFSSVLILFIIVVALATVNSWSKEKYCSTKTQQALGGNWNKPTKVTEEEMQSIPYLRASTDKNNIVFLGVKEQLICERDYKFLGIF